MTTCDRREASLALSVGGDLPPRARAKLERHLETCPRCRAFLRELEASQGARGPRRRAAAGGRARSRKGEGRCRDEGNAHGWRGGSEMDPDVGRGGGRRPGAGARRRPGHEVPGARSGRCRPFPRDATGRTGAAPGRPACEHDNICGHDGGSRASGLGALAPFGSLDRVAGRRDGSAGRPRGAVGGALESGSHDRALAGLDASPGRRSIREWRIGDGRGGVCAHPGRRRPARPRRRRDVPDREVVGRARGRRREHERASRDRRGRPGGSARRLRLDGHPRPLDDGRSRRRHLLAARLERRRLMTHTEVRVSLILAVLAGAPALCGPASPQEARGEDKAQAAQTPPKAEHASAPKAETKAPEPAEPPERGTRPGDASECSSSSTSAPTSSPPCSGCSRPRSALSAAEG
jgi:Putative zinc-finger